MKQDAEIVSMIKDLAEVPAALGSDAISAGSPDGQMALPKPTLAEMVITLQ